MRRLIAFVSCLVTASACGNVPSAPPDQRAEVDVTLPDASAAELDRLRERLDELEALEAPALLESRALSYATELGYTPRDAEHMTLIQGSSVALDSAQLDALDAHGFVITDNEYPSFGYGYHSIYAEDLPLYVSADSILEAVHRSYDEILKALEMGALIPALGELLTGMRARLATASGDPGALADADLFLAVALTLLTGTEAAPVAGASLDEVRSFVALAHAAEGAQTRRLFGVERRFDFSQFEPRGHYTDEVVLESYFRAMMWLQRVDFRLIETDDHGNQTFSRRQLEAALALRELMDGAALARWQDIDRAVEAFVGEPDYMLPPDLDAFLASIGAADSGALDARSDAELAQKIIEGGWGAQRISSHFMVNGIGQGTMPLNRSLAFFGQRYTVDAHVFSNVVYDRVQRGAVRRMMPDPLDVAYAALGNDAALPLLAAELSEYGYAADLESMRVLVDEHGASYWDTSLYTLWMSALRGLSSRADTGFAAGMPAVARTEPWQRRVLAAQLASWAELRHDTLLYAKQSYSSGAACEFPDAYVDPYPAFWRALERYADHGLALVDNLSAVDGALAARIRDHFVAVAGASRILGDMAEQELEGTPFTAAQMEFINDTVQIESVCDESWATGWYGRLHFSLSTSAELDPVVADVHTQPTDAGGAPVGRVLHVGTGLPRAMVVTVDTCTGPRAYVGLVSTYHQEITENWERLTDEAWTTRERTHVRWMRDLIVDTP